MLNVSSYTDDADFVIDKFETVAKTYPEYTALITEDESRITYTSLNQKSEAIALEISYRLKKLRKRKGEDVSQHTTPLVAVMMNRHIGFISAILGVLKAGAAFVPIDPNFPKDRRAHIINHSKCNIFLVDSECLRLAPDLVSTFPSILIIERTSGDIMSVVTHPTNFNYDPRINSDTSLAYVLFTSGLIIILK